MGSSVLKLLQITWNYWLLSPLPSSEWLLPSQDMATMVMDMAMDTVMDMAMVAMDTMVMVMARERLRPMLLLSQDMVTMVDTVMDMVLVTDMVDMDTDTMDTTARDPLMLRLSQDMATMVMVMDMAMVVMDMVMDMAMARDPLMLSPDMATTDTDTAMGMDMDMDTAMDMVTDTTDKQYKSFLLAV